MTYWEILLLAVIQGLAELLPVSSSAHLIVVAKLLKIPFDPEAPQGLFLLVMLHTGTMFAVLVYFWSRWRALLYPPEAPGEGPGKRLDYHFIKLVLLATVCTLILGFGLKVLIENVLLPRLTGQSGAEVERLFKNLPMIAAGLAAVGLVMIAAGTRPAGPEADNLTTIDALLIGLVQGLCLPFRGFSRSGATISTGLFSGLSRRTAEEFSFALVLVLTPAVILYSLQKMVRSPEWQSARDVTPLLLPGLAGMAFSFLAGLLALRVLSAVLEAGRWAYFGCYCLVASAGVVAVWWLTSGNGV
jgi:undecaprenyl-diphosphatase